MNKAEFLRALERLTSALPERERSKLAEYFGEMIDDRMEEGLPEEDAVADLGDPEALADELVPERRSLVPVVQAKGENVSALNHLRIQTRGADVEVLREPLDNGAAAQIRFSDPRRFRWHLEGDTLVIEQNPEEAVGLAWLKQLLTEPGMKVTVALPEALPGTLCVQTSGGDVELKGLRILGTAELTAASGDIHVRHSVFEGGLTAVNRSGDCALNDVEAGALLLKAQSGDLEVVNLSVGGAARMEAVSGDLTLRNLSCGELTIGASSGDVEVDRGQTGLASLRTASGDVRLDELECNPELTLETASGDVELHRCVAVHTRITTASGDVTLRLLPLPCGYDILTDTRSGWVELPGNNPSAGQGVRQPRLEIVTASGDISVKIRD